MESTTQISTTTKSSSILSLSFLLSLLFVFSHLHQTDSAPWLGNLIGGIAPAAGAAAAGGSRATLPLLAQVVRGAAPGLTRPVSNTLATGLGAAGRSGSMNLMLGGAHVVAPGMAAAGSNVAAGAGNILNGVSGTSGGVAAAAAASGAGIKVLAAPILSSVRQLADDTPAILGRMGQGVVNRGADFTDEIVGAGAGRLAPLADDYWGGAAGRSVFESSRDGFIFSGTNTMGRGQLYGVANIVDDIVDDAVQAGSRATSFHSAASQVSGAAASASGSGRAAAAVASGAAGDAAGSIAGSAAGNVGRAAASGGGRSIIGQAWDGALDAIRAAPVQGGPAAAGSAGAAGARTGTTAFRTGRSIGSIMATVGKALITKRGQMIILTTVGTAAGIGINVAISDVTEAALIARVEEADEVATEAVLAANQSRSALEVVLKHAENATLAAQQARDEVVEVRESVRRNTLSQEQIQDIMKQLVKALTTKGGLSTVSATVPKGFKPGRAKFLSADPIAFNGRQWIYFSFLTPTGVEKAVLIHPETAEIAQTDMPVMNEVEVDDRSPRGLSDAIIEELQKDMKDLEDLAADTVVVTSAAVNVPVTADAVAATPAPAVTLPPPPTVPMVLAATTTPAPKTKWIPVTKPSYVKDVNWPIVIYDDDLRPLNATRMKRDTAGSSENETAESATTGTTTTTTTTTTAAPPTKQCANTGKVVLKLVRRLLDELLDSQEMETAFAADTNSSIATVAPTSVASSASSAFNMQRRVFIEHDPDLTPRRTRTRREAFFQRTLGKLIRTKRGTEAILRLAMANGGSDDRRRGRVLPFILPFLPMIIGSIGVAKAAATTAAIAGSAVSLATAAVGVGLAAADLAPAIDNYVNPPTTTTPPPPTATPLDRVPVEFFEKAVRKFDAMDREGSDRLKEKMEHNQKRMKRFLGPLRPIIGRPIGTIPSPIPESLASLLLRQHMIHGCHLPHWQGYWHHGPYPFTFPAVGNHTAGAAAAAAGVRTLSPADWLELKRGDTNGASISIKAVPIIPGANTNVDNTPKKANPVNNFAFLGHGIAD